MQHYLQNNFVLISNAYFHWNIMYCLNSMYIMWLAIKNKKKKEKKKSKNILNTSKNKFSDFYKKSNFIIEISYYYIHVISWNHKAVLE